jgi:hypothetical protein
MADGARGLYESQLGAKYKAGLLLAGVGAVLMDAYYNPLPYSEVLQLQAREVPAAGPAAGTYSNIAEPYNTECSICLDAFTPEDQVLHTPCKHTFHHTCVRGHGLRECPNCRTALNPPLG